MDDRCEMVDDFLMLDKAFLSRKGKKEKDVRPLIKEIKVKKIGEKYEMEAHLLASQQQYLSPIDFLKVILKEKKNHFLSFTNITRKGFYLQESKDYV